mmetsp:Transcript_85091/g.236845  ORF Transcript_85091/g.236845 Transcript_85091/m.236845 type:complete len:307 (+) Transcript_85091:288-1208(+)
MRPMQHEPPVGHRLLRGDVPRKGDGREMRGPVHRGPCPKPALRSVRQPHRRVDRVRQPTQAAHEHHDHEERLAPLRPVAAEGVAAGRHRHPRGAPSGAELEHHPHEVRLREVRLRVEDAEEQDDEHDAVVAHELCQLHPLLRKIFLHADMVALDVVLRLVRDLRRARRDDHRGDGDVHAHAHGEGGSRVQLGHVAEGDAGGARGDGVEPDEGVPQALGVVVLVVLRLRDVHRDDLEEEQGDGDAQQPSARVGGEEVRVAAPRVFEQQRDRGVHLPLAQVQYLEDAAQRERVAGVTQECESGYHRQH